VLYPISSFSVGCVEFFFGPVELSNELGWLANHYLDIPHHQEGQRPGKFFNLLLQIPPIELIPSGPKVLTMLLFLD
jgi:hypothetical protein